MALNELYELLERGAATAGYAVTQIPGERILGKSICLRIHGKRCVVQMSTSIVKPPGNAFGNVRFTVRNSLTLSDSDVKALVLIIALANENPVFYILPAQDWKGLVRAQGQSTRAGTGSSPTLNVPHPPQPNSRLEQYRDNWRILA